MTSDSATLPAVARRILVVEDDGPTRSALTRLLKDRGHIAWSAITTHDGLMLLLKHRPDRLLLDLMLPGIAGEHLLHAVRAYSPETRVAVLTGIEDPDRLARLPELGADRVMRKPVDLRSILTWVAAD